jgi:hypothetical protein
MVDDPGKRREEAEGHKSWTSIEPLITKGF